MVAERHGRTVTAEDATAMVNRMSSLPAHPEVAEALGRLRETPLKVVALVNSLASVGEAQLTNAGIREHFGQIIARDTTA